VTAEGIIQRFEADAVHLCVPDGVVFAIAGSNRVHEDRRGQPLDSVQLIRSKVRGLRLFARPVRKFDIMCVLWSLRVGGAKVGF
jgi:hypothetical protein